ncbi:MAG: hypothetical protein AB7G52_11065 [Arcobacter sp.]
MSLIKNASPEVILLGADDKSTIVITPSPEPIPQHLPLHFIFARKGTTNRVLTGASKLPLLYDAASFDSNEKWFNHQTRFLRDIGGTGNTCMVQRVVPDDAGVRSNTTIYIDILETDVPNYVRNSSGDYVIDPDTNAYKVDDVNPTIPGYKIKYIKEYDNVTDGRLGMLTSKAGTMTDGTNNSTMYPLFEVKAKYQGEYYNNIGFTISSMFKEEVDDKIVSATKSLPYKISLVTRPNEKSSPVIFRSLFGEPAVNFTFKEKAINPNTDARFDLEYVFDNNWFNETDPLKSLKYNDYEGFYFYRTNFDLVTKLFITKERTYISTDDITWDDGLTASSISWFDFTTDDQTELLEENYIVNPFACKSSKNVKYFTLMYSDDVATVTGNQKEINMGVDTPVFLSGGSDGTLSNEMFETLVVAEMQKYLDADSEVIDTAINVESIFYDSGFTLDTKKELANFIALRKDTALVLSTHDASMGETDLPLSEARAVGVALKTRLKLTPESEYFGTGVARAVVLVGTGKLRDGSTMDRIPLSYEIAIKSAKMMGASTGKWKAVELFDKYPGNVLTQLVDIRPGFIPAGIKPTLWADGLVWAQPFDRSSYHLPAIQTVYDNDTSVLNSYFTIMALCTLSKIGAEAWRNFTGSVKLTNPEFIDAVTNFVNERLKDRFAGLYIVVPEVLITEEDELRGYSWRLITKLYGNNMKTKMIHHSEIYRMSDLQ